MPWMNTFSILDSDLPSGDVLLASQKESIEDHNKLKAAMQWGNQSYPRECILRDI